MNKSHLIFLDVDGVLNCPTTRDKCGDFRGIENKKVALLKRIVEAYDATIILSSSWNIGWSKDDKKSQDYLANYLDAKLAKQGLFIYDKTQDGYDLHRGQQIWNFIAQYEKTEEKVSQFLILDDYHFDFEEAGLVPYWYQTNLDGHGLTPSLVEEILSDQERLDIPFVSKEKNGKICSAR